MVGAPQWKQAPSSGRFLSMDPWMGKISNPMSLNSYVYVGNSPAMYLDPSGKFRCDSMPAENANAQIGTGDFGRQVEREVARQYCQEFPASEVDFGNEIEYGVWGQGPDSLDVFMDVVGYFKPDIFDHTLKKYYEIKPLSSGGIYGGVAKMEVLDEVYNSDDFIYRASPGEWVPEPADVGTTNVWFMNVEGLILYSDLGNDVRNAMAGATLVTLANIYRQSLNKSKKKSSKSDPYGVPVYTRAAVLPIVASASSQFLVMRTIEASSRPRYGGL